MGDTVNLGSFLQENAWWLALVLAGALLLVVGIFLAAFLAHRKKKKTPEITHSLDKNEYFEAIGGETNLISKELRGSRIVLQLRDCDIVDQPKLKEIGVDGFILMSEKLTLVIKGDAKAVYEALFGKSDS